jgi:uncharacterized protein
MRLQVAADQQSDFWPCRNLGRGGCTEPGEPGTRNCCAGLTSSPSGVLIPCVKRHIGVISDTHGLLRPGAVAALRDCALIIHAGDVGRPDVLEGLRPIAPLFAIRGNVDKGPWAQALPETEVVEVDDCRVYVLHDMNKLDVDPPTAGFHAIIAGHTHRAGMEMKHGVLYFNPGSAGPRRFALPITVGRLVLAEGQLLGKIVTLIE